MRQYVIGVDGGGTKTHYALFDTNGNLIYFIQGGPGNHESYLDGYEGIQREFTESFQKIVAASGVNLEDISYGFFGLAGIDVPSQKKVLLQMLKGMGLKNLQIMNDTFLGIKAASVHGYGICSNNGTGTSCAGIDPQGTCLQIGGTGYYFGDEGGAGHLGGMTVRKVYDYLFRCGQPTMMKELLFETLQITHDLDFVETIYQKNYYNNWVEFSKIPFIAANLGDPVASELLEYTGRQGAKSVIGAARRLDFSRVDEIDIIMTGSVYVKGENPTLVSAFKQEIQANISQKVCFTVLRVPPVAGAVMWAFEALDRELSIKYRKEVTQELSRILLQGKYKKSDRN